MIKQRGGSVQIILNYKSYFEAFRLGVVNNRFKPVAEVLFLLYRKVRLSPNF